MGTVLDPNGSLINPSGWEPSVAWTGSDFIAVWIGYRGLIGRFIGEDGTPVGDTFRVVSSTGTLYNTDAAAGSGVIMTVWAEDNGSGCSVYGQMLSSTGSLIGPPFWIGNGYSDKSLSVCYQDNRFLVVYTKGVSAENIYGRFYDSTGQALGIEFPVSHSSGHCFFCSAAAGTNGRYLCVWAQNDSGYTDIYGSVDILYGVEEKTSPPSRTIMPGSFIVSNFVQIKGLRGIPVTLYDAVGQMVFKGRLKDMNRRLRDGVYFMVEDDRTRYKIILVSH